MKKVFVLIFSLALIIAMSSCSKVVEKIGDKVEEKIDEKVDEVLENVEDKVDTDLIDEVISDKDNDENTDKEKDEEDKKDESDDKGSNKKSGGSEATFNDKDIEKIDASAKDIALIKSCTPIFRKNIFDNVNSVFLHMKTKYKDEDSDSDYVNTEMLVYIDGDDARIQAISDIEEENVTTIINEKDKLTYVFFPDNTGYKLPYIKGESDLLKSMRQGFDFNMTEDDYDSVIEAKITEYEGEKVLYIKSKDDEGEEINELWYSLKRSFPVKMITKSKEGEIVEENTLVDMELNKNYTDLMEEPKEVEWKGVDEMFKDVVNKVITE